MSKAYSQLKKLDLKATTARKQILNLFQENPFPMDVQVIFEKLNTAGEKTDRATIYRILGTFILKGVVKQLDFQEGKFRYELASLPHHHHLICESCGHVDDVQDCVIQKELEQYISKANNFTITTHRLDFFGQCGKCKL
ncbi:MAG: transcriptional repressor [Candidatus Roizmanbacteria bacterium]